MERVVPLIELERSIVVADAEVSIGRPGPQHRLPRVSELSLAPAGRLVVLHPEDPTRVHGPLEDGSWMGLPRLSKATPGG